MPNLREFQRLQALEALEEARAHEQARRGFFQQPRSIGSGFGIEELMQTALGIGSNVRQGENELSFGGSYPVTSIGSLDFIESHNIQEVAADIVDDWARLTDNPSYLNSVKTNKYFNIISSIVEDAGGREAISQDEVIDKVGAMVSVDLYGKSVADLNQASQYSNEIITSFLDRASLDNKYDPTQNPFEVNYTVMPGNRRSSVCADTACAIYTGAGMANYLPWDQTANKWSSDNDYIIDALAGRKKGDTSYMHWDTVGSGVYSESLKDVQPGDWVIVGRGEAWLPRDHPERCGGRGNESCKHSMVVIDVTENGILFGSGNATATPWEHQLDEEGREPLSVTGINTRFMSWDSLNSDSEAGYQAKAYRFNPKGDNFVFFKDQLFTQYDDDSAYNIMEGRLTGRKLGW